MKVRITILSENLIGRAMGSAEHGFSAFIETQAAAEISTAPGSAGG
jgi:hypothetical protein